MSFVNIQSLKPKLDMLIHNMHLHNIDKYFITETWTQCGNEPEQKYIKTNLDTGGYKIFIQCRENRKGEDCSNIQIIPTCSEVILNHN